MDRRLSWARRRRAKGLATRGHASLLQAAELRRRAKRRRAKRRRCVLSRRLETSPRPLAATAHTARTRMTTGTTRAPVPVPARTGTRTVPHTPRLVPSLAEALAGASALHVEGHGSHRLPALAEGRGHHHPWAALPRAAMIIDTAAVVDTRAVVDTVTAVAEGMTMSMVDLAVVTVDPAVDPAAAMGEAAVTIGDSLEAATAATAGRLIAALRNGTALLAEASRMALMATDRTSHRSPPRTAATRVALNSTHTVGGPCRPAGGGSVTTAKAAMTGHTQKRPSRIPRAVVRAGRRPSMCGLQIAWAAAATGREARRRWVSRSATAARRSNGGRSRETADSNNTAAVARVGRLVPNRGRTTHHHAARNVTQHRHPPSRPSRWSTSGRWQNTTRT